MRTRSKWKPCDPEMYWMCPRRFYSVYNIDILWSRCSIIHPPLWLQSHTGIPLSSAPNCKFLPFSCWWDSRFSCEPVSIQRVLEHCADPKTQQIVMDEILQAICMLAQDQYGNYVVQVSTAFWFFELVVLFPILNTPSVPNCRSLDFFNPKFDHSSYSKICAKHHFFCYGLLY